MSKLPSLPPVHSTSPSLDNWIKAVTEHLEVLEGRRGDPTYQAVTKAVFDANTGQLRASVNQALNRSAEEFARTLQQTAAFKELKAKIGQYDALSASVRETIRQMVNEMSSKLGADIASKQIIQQDAINSLAIRLDSVQSGLGDSLASVRELSVASSDYLGSVASRVTTVEASVNPTIAAADIVTPTPYDDLAALELAVPTGVVGKYYRVKDAVSPDTNPNQLYTWNGTGYVFAAVDITATVEQKLTALATRAGHAEGQYSLKINANKKIAGFDLIATSSEAGVTTSEFIVQADKFAVVTGDDTHQTTPFGVDANGVYINGLLRVGSGTGPTVSGATTNRVYLTYSTQFFRYNSSGTLLNSSLTLSANLAGTLTGYVDWSQTGYGGTMPANGTTNSLTVNASDVSGENATFTITKVVDGVTYTDVVTVSKLRDGSNGTNGTNGTNGSRGATTTNGAGFGMYVTDINVTYNDRVFVWSDTVAHWVIAVATGVTTAPSPGDDQHYGWGFSSGQAGTKAGDTVTLSGPRASKVTGTQTKMWNGTAWVAFSQIIDGNLLVNGTIVADKIVAGAITTAKISDSNVTTGKIENNGVTAITNNVRSYDFTLPYSSQTYYPMSGPSSNITPAVTDYYADEATAAAAGALSVTPDYDHVVLLALALNFTTNGCIADQSNVVEYRVKVLWPGRSWSTWAPTSRSDSGAIRLNYAYGRIILPTSGTEFATVTPSVSVLSGGANQIIVTLTRPAIGGTMTYKSSSVITLMDFKR